MARIKNLPNYVFNEPEDKQEYVIRERPKQYQRGIDTFERVEANMTPQEIIACCKFSIDKYNWREKGSDEQDFIKIIDYANFAIKQIQKLNLQAYDSQTHH